MDALALLGGNPVRKQAYPEWPFYETDEELQAIVGAFQSGHLCGAAGGEQIPALEVEFAAWCGAAGAVAVNSGSSALQTALAAVDVGVGDEVIVPSYTYYSSATSVLDRGAIPVFADIDRATANLDPESFRALITERTKAVMAVHANGIPVDMDAVLAIANEHGIAVVEDCSHSHGAVYKGKRVGCVGHVGAFSIQHKKILSVGEGGLVVSRDAEIVAKARAYANLGQGTKTGILGPNLRMGELHGALARVRLGRVDAENVIRRANAQMLREAIADLPGVRAVPGARREGVDETYYNFTLDYDAQEIGVPRRRFAEAVQAEGIPLRVNGYSPLNLMPVFENMDVWPYRLTENRPSLEGRKLYGEGVCPVAEAFMTEGNFELKIHPPCGEAEIMAVAEAVRKVITQAGNL
ncbi:MAG: dTDP-4-amino-4,6-dideoxygalactose transaminase [Candidatus Latescibacterota bacterium]|jgi:dTDP-4-amino-4,6-dideoxygalactose transaminase